MAAAISLEVRVGSAGHCPATVNKSLAHLERLGIVAELTKLTAELPSSQ